MYNFIMAAALLVAPVDDVSEINSQLIPDIKAIAVSWEILDFRELNYVLTRPEDLPSDLKLLRQRYRDFVGAPSLSDSFRFPDRLVISDMLAFNRAYRQNLENRLAVELVRYWELQEAIQETDKLYQAWDLARDAKCDYYYVTVRRQALKRLRDMIGPKAYYSNNLLPYVPLWRFQVID